MELHSSSVLESLNSISVGASSSRQCSGILAIEEGSGVAYTTGIIVFIIFILSFVMVPSGSVSDTPIMRFQLTASFQGGLQKHEKAAKRAQRCTGFEKFSTMLSNASSSSDPDPATEKRFFDVGDSVRWLGQEWGSDSDAFIGTVESTSTYPGQDADDHADFDVFLKIDASFLPLLQRLQDFIDSDEVDKPVLIDPLCRSCQCQLKTAPSSHARLPIFGCTVGPWEKVRQINACFQLLFMAFFPAVDTISDLIYILSSVFANYYIFAASLFFITSQFWFFVKRLKQRHVFKAFQKRRIDLKFVRGLSYWPKWASPDSLIVCLTMILPLYFIYYILFPIVWFLLGYVLYSFQFFPISRISNRWLYVFV